MVSYLFSHLVVAIDILFLLHSVIEEIVNFERYGKLPSGCVITRSHHFNDNWLVHRLIMKLFIVCGSSSSDFFFLDCCVLTLKTCCTVVSTEPAGCRQAVS